MMADLAFIDNQLKQQAQERYERFGTEPIFTLLAPAPEFRHVPERWYDFMIENREGIQAWLRHYAGPAPEKTMLRFFVSRMMMYLYQHNQFLQISPAQQADLEAIYARFVRNYLLPVVRAEDGISLREQIITALADHQAQLAQFVQAIGRENGSLDFTLAEPVCSQYSPQLQLELLGLSVDSLEGPVLDIGCGPDARLVRYLNAAGILSYGMDRGVESTSHTIQSDWFGFPLEMMEWGTIISHMAFSTHFLHHHLRRNGHPEQYASRYMQILQALKRDGRFIYTPGLPFIEMYLPPDQYVVEQHHIRTNKAAFAAVPSLSNVSYTTIITRL
ncbi:hypothetical protein G4Y79_09430 [Phototrophicus methaneseepsis]|uniref:Uncharacterized protein n=1 Tax=Phototrophicus methaneseepsis TaxID=2710758 RepID=A0A7S8ECR0_9CHLR|nr:hypothetical protein [Phototrophicus methaneseepsis]QPC84577.1 hypothetical protein G4Y79_09430 [Phototrophicus methaneseepsis]